MVLSITNCDDPNNYIIMFTENEFLISVHCKSSKMRVVGLRALGSGVALGLLFTCLQGFEYYVASFTIADSVYGSVFYLMTGAHGLHVIIGSVFLTVCWFRLLYYQFRDDDPVGFELAAWYWHFVDV